MTGLLNDQFPAADAYDVIDAVAPLVSLRTAGLPCSGDNIVGQERRVMLNIPKIWEVVGRLII